MRAGLEQHDAVGDRHRFGLVVRHMDRREPERGDQQAQPAARVLAQSGVEIGQRLVEQDHRRRVDQRARDGDALLLPAGKLRRQPRGERAEIELRQHSVDALRDLVGRDVAQLEAGRDVLEHRAVRPQRVRLEHEAEPALLRRQVDAARGVEENALADRNRAGVRPLQAGDGAQQRGLAAAGGAEQRDRFAGGDGQRDALQNFGAAEPQQRDP